MASNRLRGALQSLRDITSPRTRVESIEAQRKRFNKRLQLVDDPNIKRDLKHYRNQLMRRTFNSRGDLGEVTHRRARGDEYRHFPDEFELLHKRLDKYDIPPCFG